MKNAMTHQEIAKDYFTIRNMRQQAMMEVYEYSRVFVRNLRRVKHIIGKRRYDILKYRYMGKTLKETGEKFCMSGESVRSIEKTVEAKMEKMLGAKLSKCCDAPMIGGVQCEVCGSNGK